MDIHACIHTYTQTHICTIAPDNSPEVVKTGRLSDTDDNPFDHPVRFKMSTTMIINDLSTADY